MSIHTETVFLTLSVVAVLVVLTILAIFLYRRYTRGRIIRGAAVLVTAPTMALPSYNLAPPPYATAIQYVPMRYTPALMGLGEGVEIQRPLVRHLSQDQLDDVARVLRQCSSTT